MQITRAADYAVRVMVHLATLPPGSRVQRSTLVELSDAPGSFLSKVLQRMVCAGLICSRRGTGGGFELAVPPENISLLRVVEAIDGPIQLNLCVSGAPGCERRVGCVVHPVWEEAQTAITKMLGSVSMAKLAEDELKAAAARNEELHSIGNGEPSAAEAASG